VLARVNAAKAKLQADQLRLSQTRVIAIVARHRRGLSCAAALC
jgi:hypothetical protein